MTRLLELLNDYCLALELQCSYEIKFQDFLVLPSKLKLRSVTSSVDRYQILKKTFDEIETLYQKISYSWSMRYIFGQLVHFQVKQGLVSSI